MHMNNYYIYYHHPFLRNILFLQLLLLLLLELELLLQLLLQLQLQLLLQLQLEQILLQLLLFNTIKIIIITINEYYN